MGLDELKKKLSSVKGTVVDILSQSEVSAARNWLKTPAHDLNRVMSGDLFKGVPERTFTLFIGPEACVDENSIISYEVHRNGKRTEHKKQRIKTLYNRFHNNRNGRVFKSVSINEDNCIITNHIIDIVKTGKKDCFLLKTNNGNELIATNDHKIYIGNGKYSKLGDLKVNDIIYIQNNERNKKKNKKRINYKEVFVKYHPTSSIKVVNNCTYYRLKYSNMVYEAYLNDMTVEEYRYYLNNETKENINKLNFIDKENFDIHHMDKNEENDDITNLELLSKTEHYRLHANENHNNLRFIASPDTVISIESVGIKETYDIKCLYPYNNYIANGIVVHNSGKSSFMCLCLAEAIRNGYTPVVIDTEGGWDANFVKRWGLNPDEILHVYTPWIDQICMTLGQIIESGDKKLAIALDSIGGTEKIKLLKDSVSGDVKADQGTLQKEIKRMLKMLLNVCKAQQSIALASGHYYGNPSGYGEADQIGGGKFVKLAPDIIVSLKKTKLFENPSAKSLKDKGKVVGSEVKAITLKNRYYPPFQEAKIEIDFNKGINKYAGLMDLMIESEMVTVGGAWYTFPDGQKVQGMIKSYDYFKENADKYLIDLSDWLSNTGYSTINENVKEAAELVKEEENDKEN